MPERIARLIETETAKNKTYGVIPQLAALLKQDPDVETAYLCDASTVHITKLSGEGNHFCAYRNIQMLLQPQTPEYSIPQLQEMIEYAWTMGFNKHGHTETGGIQGTRKHIGTSEVSP